MNETYRVGQVAKQLEVSSYLIRRLCEAGAVEAEVTDGGQYRIPLSELARLKKDGLPPLPARVDPPAAAPPPVASASHGRAGRPTYEERGLLAKPSPVVVGALEKTVVNEQELRQLKIKKEKEETQDWFRDRERRRLEENAAERARIEQQQAAAARDRWRLAWIEKGLLQIPDEPPDAQLEAAREILTALDGMDYRQSDVVTSRIIDQAIEKALAPWRRQRSLDDAIEQIANDLPYALKYGPEFTNAKETIRRTLLNAEDGRRPISDLFSIGQQASQPFVAAVEHRKRCGDLASYTLGWNISRDDKEAAEDAVKEALDALPIGTTPDRVLVEAKEAALEPFRVKKRVSEETSERLRQELQQRDREQQQQKRAQWEQRSKDEQRDRAKKNLIDDALGYLGLYSYLERLEKKWEFEKSTFALWHEIRDAIRPQLEREVEADDTPEDVSKLMRQLARQELEI